MFANFIENITKELRPEVIYSLPKSVCNLLPQRMKQSHKGTYGHAHLIAGSKGKMGAAILMAKSAVRSGVGLVTITAPSIGRDVLQITVPPAMCGEENGAVHWEISMKSLPNYTYGIGPGIGTTDATCKALFQFLEHVQQPLVLDADALNCISMHPHVIQTIPKNSILTPHVGEFQRLVGVFENDSNRIEMLRNWSVKHQQVVVLKDYFTLIGTPSGKVYFSNRGTNGMATGGSGDVLAGLLTGLLAQGLSSLEAARVGVIVHGLAGEFAAEKWTDEAMTAEDIVQSLGDSFKKLNRIKDSSSSEH